MINSIAEYLHQLRHELAGCDPATVLDALSDTEDHLNTAVAGAIAANPRRAASMMIRAGGRNPSENVLWRWRST